MRLPSRRGLVQEAATIGQRLLWALDRVRGESGALNCPMICSIDGPLETSRLREALSRVVASHVALRTTMRPGRTIRQLFHPPRPARIELRDLSSEGDAAVADFLRRELTSRIDPTLSPLRVSLLRRARRSHVLVVNAHHVATDLWSTVITLEDLAAALDGQPSTTKNDGASWDYAEFSRWQRRQTESGAFAQQQRYWQERLAGMRPIPTPLQWSPRHDRDGSTGLLEAAVEPDTRARLETIARDHATSSFAVLLAVLFAMVFRQTSERDLAVASLLANRARPQFRRTVGFLVDLFMLRVRLRRRPGFLDFVEQSRRAVSGALANPDVPYHAVSPRPLEIEHRGHARADDVVFHAYLEPLDMQLRTEFLDLRMEVPEVVGRFDIELAVRPVKDGLRARLTYNERRLAAAAASEILDGYVETARLVARDPESPVERLSS